MAGNAIKAVLFQLSHDLNVARGGGTGGEELFSTNNRQPADGLAGLPRDYTGPILGPPLPGDLGRPILSAQNAGQPVVPPVVPAPVVDEAEQRRRAEEGPAAARLLAAMGLVETQVLPLPNGNFYRFVTASHHYGRGDGIVYLSALPEPQARLIETIRSALRAGNPV